MRQHGPRFSLVLATAAIAAVALAGAAQASTTHAAATTTQVKAGEFYFKLSAKSLAKPGKVTFIVKNAGHVSHDFRIDGKQTALLKPGSTAKLIVTFKKAGKYPYLCTVIGHAAAGMEGVFTVR
jgi:uncharacterized cupredoxin-like copper-binding protein